MKTATQMIVHSAGCHLSKREQIHLQRVLAAVRLGFSSKNAGEEIQGHWPRKFRGNAEASFMSIIAARNLLIGCVEIFPAELRPGLGGSACRTLVERGDDFAALLCNFFAILLPSRPDSFP